MKNEPGQVRNKVYFILLFFYAVAIALLFWNQFRPRIVLARCSEVAFRSSQTYNRTELTNDENIKSYEELLNNCLQDFGL